MNELIPGRDYIGVGVGALVMDPGRTVFMARRGPGTRNEVGTWEFPGGAVRLGENLKAAVRREFIEEYGMEIEPLEFLGLFDHILPDENEHWISATFIARHVSGVPEIREPEKCTEIGWFKLNYLPEPQSKITKMNVERYRSRK